MTATSKKMAGCTGLEFSTDEQANRATTHANSSIRSDGRQVRTRTDFGRVPRNTPQFRRSLGDILETDSHGWRHDYTSMLVSTGTSTRGLMAE